MEKINLHLKQKIEAVDKYGDTIASYTMEASEERRNLHQILHRLLRMCSEGAIVKMVIENDHGQYFYNVSKSRYIQLSMSFKKKSYYDK